MATLSKADSRRMYSWWWNSHISPKNSKWLQENLTDMDIKVKSMIKLIEEDADSFARRAEMYYKKRPELMKLVEEFYRAYRALAERYDHASGALRQAQKTITEAFPNQVPLLPDDPLVYPATDADPQTPETRTPARTLFDFDDLQKDYSDEKSGASQKGLKQLNESLGSKGIVRKGLKFHESEEGNKNHKSQARVNDKEIILLKEALAKVEDERKAGLKQYHECLDRLTKLESEISHAQRDSRELAERVIKAEDEAQILKDALQRLEAEKEESLNLYHFCLDKISNLENDLSRAQGDIEELNHQVKNGENVAQNLKNDIIRLEDEKNAAQGQYNRSLEMISDLEKKLMDAEEEARKLSVHAEKAELEVETLKQTVAILTEKKEEQALLYQQCLEIISSLELRLSCAQEEAERLNGEIDNGVAMLKGAEEQCLMLEKSNQSLHSELESMVLKMGAQTQDLTEKEKEMGRLWTCIQEERVRFVEAETAFQTLQHLHSQTREELKSLASELQNKAQVLRDMETCNQDLQGEIEKHKEENKNLNELNFSSAILLGDMKTEISSLKESREKLEEEVELQVDQRNALQKEIYGLKDELNELNKNHKAILEQVAYTGLNPECFGSSVKELQDENSKLKEESETERSEKVALLEKLEIMGQLLEKNAFLENSLSDLGAELEGARGKIKTLEDSYRFLFEEKSTLAGEKDNLLSQLQVTNGNLSEVSEKNNILESTLFDAHVELELLKQKSKNFEESCQLLADEKSILISEKSTLASKMEIAEKSLNDLDLKYADLEAKYTHMEKERESTLSALAELHVSLAVQNQEHATFAQMNERQLNHLKTQIQLLQEENRNRSKEFDNELDKALGSEIEIFILQRSVHDLEEQYLSLLSDCEKLQEASRLSERLIHELKQEKNDNHLKIQSLADQNNTWRTGMHQLLKIAGIGLKSGCENGQEQTSIDRIRSYFEATNHGLVEMEDKNQELVVEMSIIVTLLSQLKTEMADLEAEKDGIFQELKVRAEKILELQSEAQKLLKTNDELRSRVSEADRKEETLRNQLESLHGEFSIVQGAYRSLQMENSAVLEEKRALAKNNLQMEEEIRILEEENYTVFDEVLCQSSLSILLEKYLDEKYTEINWLCEDLQKLHGVNITISEKMSMVETKLEEVQMENLHLKKRLENSEHELESVVSVHDKMKSELVNEKNLLHLKEKEHMEAEKKVRNLENEKAGLSNILVMLQKEYDEVITTRDEQGKQILELSEHNDRLSKEYLCLGESSRILEIKMHEFYEEQKRSKNREETLCFELQKERDEIQLLETQASAVYNDLQTSTLCQALFEEKVRELTEVCLSLQEEGTSKNVDIELLKERACNLERENGDLKTHLASYFTPLIDLRDCILSLENHICTSSNAQKSHNEEEKCAETVNHTDQDQDTTGPDALAILQNLQSKVKAIEIAVLEMEKLSEQKLDADAKLETALKQIEELKYNTNSQRVYGRPPSTSEISDADAGLEPKDIMLDQASECSSYGISKRELEEGDIWERADQNGGLDINVENKKVVKYETTSDAPLEGSKRFREKEIKRKFLEKLNSDVQKLTNLQITIDGLKRKLEITKRVESENLKGQLVEAETDIEKMFELNVKLVKHLEGEKSTTELEESQSLRVSEQAKRVSEKIGRVQLEVQKIQFLMLKMDDEKEVKVKVKSGFLDSKGVFLKDGKTKATISSSKRNKRRFCACIKPPTKGD